MFYIRICINIQLLLLLNVCIIFGFFTEPSNDMFHIKIILPFSMVLALDGNLEQVAHVS